MRLVRCLPALLVLGCSGLFVPFGTFAQDAPKFSSATSAPKTALAVLEIHDLPRVLPEVEKHLAMICSSHPRMQRDYQTVMYVMKQALGLHPLHPGQLEEQGFDPSQPLEVVVPKLTFRQRSDYHYEPRLGGLSIMASIGVKDPVAVLGLLRRVANKLPFEFTENTASQPTTYELTMEGEEVYLAAAFREQRLYVMWTVPAFGGRPARREYLRKEHEKEYEKEGPRFEEEHLDEYRGRRRSGRIAGKPPSQALRKLLKIKPEDSLASDRRFAATVKKLPEKGGVRAYFSVKRLSDELPLDATPALLNDIVAAAVSTGQDGLTAVVQLAKYAEAKPFLKPGASCREFLAKADPPLGAATFSLDRPLEFIRYFVANTEPRMLRYMQDDKLQNEFGAGFDQLNQLLSKGSGGMAVYPDGVMGFLKVNDREFVKRHMDEQFRRLEAAERDFGEKIGKENGKEFERRPGPPRRRGISRKTYGPNTFWLEPWGVANAVVDDYLVVGNATRQINNLARGEGDGWKPRCGGTELCSAEFDLGRAMLALAGEFVPGKDGFPRNLRSALEEFFGDKSRSPASLTRTTRRWWPR